MSLGIEAASMDFDIKGLDWPDTGEDESFRKSRSKVSVPKNPKLVRKKDDMKMKPSDYLQTMTLSTEKLLASLKTMHLPQKIELLDMTETSLQKISTLSIDVPLFQPFPSEVVFQNFEPFKSYEIPLLLRNSDSVPRLVKVIHDESAYFEVISPPHVGVKIGPGLPSIYKIVFTPNENKDYYHQLICITEREKFVVPVRGIGPRAILDFPDEVLFPVSPVKHMAKRTILIRNIGTAAAKFSLSTESPFSVTPDSGTIALNESLQLSVNYQSLTTGSHNSQLVVQYNTGEVVYVKLSGTAEDVLIKLDKSKVRLNNTFLTMSSEKIITIHNRSDVIAHFKWTRFATREEEIQHKQLLSTELVSLEFSGSEYLDESDINTTLEDKAFIIKRTVEHRKQVIQKADVLFSDDIITLDPLVGDIWPNSSIDIRVLFNPHEAGEYSCTAFCDVTGRESRLPLLIQAVGIGPAVKLSLDQLDIGNIFVFSKHQYEVILANYGDIVARYSLRSSSAAVLGCFEVSPMEGVLEPGGYQAIQISFNASMLGDIQEEFCFKIDGSPEDVRLIVSGKVLTPTLKFDVAELNFGKVSYGFETRRTCKLFNTSLVPLNFHLHIPDDGEIPAVHCEDLSTLDDIENLPVTANVKEFEIRPCTRSLPAQSEVDIEVILRSSSRQKYDTVLQVDIEGINESLYSLPIWARCIVPHITSLTGTLNMGRCFLNHSYDHTIELHNDTDLPACYYLLPCPADNVNEFGEPNNITYSSCKAVGILKPRSVTGIPISLSVLATEEVRSSIEFKLVGNSSASVLVEVFGQGEGPVIYVSPGALDWGQIPVLTKKPKSLLLTNESLIPANFSTSLARRGDSMWRVSPVEGIINPDETIELIVTAYFNDAVGFGDKLELHIENGQTYSISLTGIGKGTTIVSDPPLPSDLDLGSCFTRTLVTRRFVLTNMGRRHQSFVWNTEGFSLRAVNQAAAARLSAGANKHKDTSGKKDIVCPVFYFKPARMELNPGESEVFTIEAYVERPRNVSEKLQCIAVLGGAVGKEVIKKVSLTCDFVDPVVQFSSDLLSFTVNKGPVDELTVQSKSFSITNVSSLPTTAILSLEYPFSIISGETGQAVTSKSFDLDVNETHEVVVLFDPSYDTGYHSRSVHKRLTVSYRDNPHCNHIELEGIVNFPNLEFESRDIDFGCIMLDTEETKHLSIRNPSPLEVNYKFSFVVEEDVIADEAISETTSSTPVSNTQREYDQIISDKYSTDVEIIMDGDEVSGEKTNEVVGKKDIKEHINEYQEEKKDKGKDSPIPLLDYINLEDLNPSTDLIERYREKLCQTYRYIDVNVNSSVAALLVEGDQRRDEPKIEEIFDITPIYGKLEPGESEQISITFYGHSQNQRNAKVLCEVEGGPTYEIKLQGQSSVMNYYFDSLDINTGPIPYDNIHETSISLCNTSHVGFNFAAVGMDPEQINYLKPGVPAVTPTSGHVEAFKEVSLTVKFIPNGPRKFHFSFQIQVAHFAPETVNIYGEGIFPRVLFDLPRDLNTDQQYQQLVKEAKESVLKQYHKDQSAVKQTGQRDADQAECPVLAVWQEVERLVVMEYFESQQVMNSQPDILTVDRSAQFTSTEPKQTGKSKTRPQLPEYTLDFGHVILGTVCTRIVTASNNGCIPVSFSVDRKSLKKANQLGFYIELPKVVQLPSSEQEIIEFMIIFDPRAAGLDKEKVDTTVNINILNGPQMGIRLLANVVVPGLVVSSDRIEFGEVKCGDCRIVSVQLCNKEHVPCEWVYIPAKSGKSKEKTNKHTPLHLKKRNRIDKALPPAFEMDPMKGVLKPGEKQNIQIKFLPTEQKSYEEAMALSFSMSSVQLIIRCTGQGLEPCIEFSQQIVQFGPILPQSSADEKEIVIRNPCPFAVEIYSLEFDKIYLEEEKILRVLNGYDEFNRLLLPPRSPSDKLPFELSEYYEDHVRRVEELERRRKELQQTIDHVTKPDELPAVSETILEEETLASSRAEASERHSDVNSRRTGQDEQLTGRNDEVPPLSVAAALGEVERNPVSAAIARYLGVDLSAEGQAARNQRGIAFIVHGAPVSGKTKTAELLSDRYGAAVLSIDSIVLEALSKGTSVAAMQARELCSEAARRYRLEHQEVEEGSVRLSLEAVTAHTQGIGQIGGSSTVSGGHSTMSNMMNRKASTVSVIRAEKHYSKPLPPAAPSASGDSLQPRSRFLSISTSVAGDEGFMNVVLPEDIMIELISARLQRPDCIRGIIFDGLESMFTQNVKSSGQIVLKAINNRKYIFAVIQKLEYQTVKEANRQAELKQKQEEEARYQEELHRLAEMSEQEYEALSESEQKLVDEKQLHIKRERMKRKNAARQIKKDQEEEDRLLAEAKRLEKERSTKKGRKPGDKSLPKDGKKSTSTGKIETKSSKFPESSKKGADNGDMLKQSTESSVIDKSIEKPESIAEEKKKRIADEVTGTERLKSSRKIKDDEKKPDAEVLSDNEIILMQRFKQFELSAKDVHVLFTYWDRSTGKISPQAILDGFETGESPVQRRGRRLGTRPEREDRRERRSEHNTEEASVDDVVLTEAEKLEKRLAEGIGIPHLEIDCKEMMMSNVPYEKITSWDKIPSPEEVLDGMGIGPKGPPLPPNVDFSVVQFPIERQAPGCSTHYQLLMASAEESTSTVEDKSQEREAEETLSTDQSVSTGGKPRVRRDERKKPDGERRERTRRASATRASRVSGRRSSTINSTTPHCASTTPAPESRTYRWVIPAEGEVTVRISFSSDFAGQFDQTFNFEIVGTRRRYQLHSRGIAAFPSISREPRIVFPNRVKSIKLNDIVHKKYVISTETFEFGPLLVGKSRDRYLEFRYPDNFEKLNVVNTSPLLAEVSFCFLNDVKEETYLIEPKTLTLEPNQQEIITLWAYPKSSGVFEDSLVCCIKENPEPVQFKVKCYGVKPELELDKKVIHFDKVLLHRKDSKTIMLKNPTLLPVAWRLTGLDNLGEEFSVSQDSGIVPPRTEFPLNAYFRALKAVSLSKKSIRLEVSDVDGIAGLLQTENIQVHAEAYDVILDLGFGVPKGASADQKSKIDFDTVRVSDEVKQLCTVKNKGKYDISYQFKFTPTADCPQSVCNMFSITPSQGKLTPTERPAQLQVTFKASREIQIKEQPILSCQIIEPNVAANGETIACIPVEVSARSVYTKYAITPESDINFGALLINSRKTRTFVIENRGDKFDLKFAIMSAAKSDIKNALPLSTDRKVSKVMPKRNDTLKSDETGSGHRSKRNSMRFEGMSSNQIRLTLGMFTIYPAFGSISPGSAQTITVDSVAETQGVFAEDLSIDIIGRHPKDNPCGISYKLLSEVCIPSINTDDTTSIFEEHRIFKSAATEWSSHDIENGGIFSQDEKRFIFTAVLVGNKSKARFKISNTKRVPCDVNFSVKTTAAKGVKSDVFEVTPVKAQISANSSVYVTVTFSPMTMQIYTAMFEAVLESFGPNQPKGRSLQFELYGEGTLPHVSIIKPGTRSKKGQPLLLFKRGVIGSSQTRPIVVVNDGSLTCKIDVRLDDADGVFSVRNTKQLSDGSVNASKDSRNKVLSSAVLSVGEMVTFEVTYRPQRVGRSVAQLSCALVDNQYEDTVVQLVGEGYEELITVELPHNVLLSARDSHHVNVADECIEALGSNFLNFGDCPINDSSTFTFSMTNHSSTDNVRFSWPDHPNLTFSPKVGHLLHGCTKDITVSFKTDKPVTLNSVELKCKVTKIVYEDISTSEYIDWDERLKIVKWVDVPTSAKLASPDSQRLPSDSVDQPRKKKVIEIEPEPTYREAAEFSEHVSILVAVNADYASYTVSANSFNFKDTLMFQTRSCKFQLTNTGSVGLSYKWKIVLDDYRDSPTDHSEHSSPSSARHLVTGDGEIRLNSVESGDVDYQPFSIEPEIGTVLPGISTEFTVKFSPLDISDYSARLLCSIPNLKVDEHGPVIGVRARSLMPYCHFELEDSDYIRASRRNPALPGPHGAPPGISLDPNTRVMELTTVGVDVKCVKSFTVINPTNQNFEFLWINEDSDMAKAVNNIRCLTPAGKILSGKTAQISFEYLPASLDLMESFWRFTISQQNISVPFLLVGHAREPNIIFDKSHINFQTVMIGQVSSSTVTIINNEDSEFSFAFDEESCHIVGCKSKLAIEPMSGIVAPKSRLTITLTLQAQSEREINVNLTCSVKRKDIPLTLNVKAQGYRMYCTVMCEDKHGNKRELNCTGTNLIDFGRVNLLETSVNNISVTNLGRFPFSYNYRWGEGAAAVVRDGTLSLDQVGSVTLDPGEKETSMISYCPKKSKSLHNCSLALQVEHGPLYNIEFQGSAWFPQLNFSFTSHNFGTCFVYQAGMTTQSVVLSIRNTESVELSLNCLYESTSWLQHDFKPQTLSAAQSVDITFTFLPRQPMRYKETVTFEINGLSKQHIEFCGRGTALNIETADPRHKQVKFGALKVGQTAKKIIPIINNSLAPVTCNLSVSPRIVELQESGVLVVSPQRSITLPGKGGTVKVEVSLSPKSRIAAFSEEVFVEFGGMRQTIFIITGSCQGIDISLDTASIPFGAVVQKSSSVRQLVMRNNGDIGARFKWEENKLLPNFSITPVDGYIAAGMDVNFTVAFHPTVVGNDIRCQGVKCNVEGMSALQLTLTGSCVSIPIPKEGFQCTTVVRQREVKGLQIVNNTTQVWNLKPIIDGEYWSGPETIQVMPLSTKIYELTYHPLTMTVDGKKHQASVFFPLPDGTGLMYNVSGTAEPPKVTDKITRDVPCKVSYSELLSVNNWLKVPQRFTVKIENQKQDKLDSGTTINGLDHIYVPALSSKNFKLDFHSYKECQVQVTVTFTNEQTGEYQFYEVSFRATRPGPISVISLTVPVRQRKQHTITLHNPLSTVVTFPATCNLPDIQFPTQIVIPPLSQGVYTFEYFPLKVGKTQGKLEFSSSDLGLYSYELDLKATPAGPERTLTFNVALGSSQTLTARFINYFKQKTDYIFKVDNAEFHVDKSLAAAPASSSGTEVSFDVVYEPSSLGECHSTLVLSSQAGGEYTFPLHATCTLPKPQGPFKVKSGSTTGILFRNVFQQATQFTFHVDNPAFRIVKSTETIRPRKEHRIVVGFDGSDVSAATGKLVVTCDQSVGGVDKPQWVYYLKGVMPEGRES